jgi:glycosyltransferase involved in cell wall biosynthesis
MYKNILIACNLKFDKYNGGMEMASFNLTNLLLKNGNLKIVIGFTDYVSKIDHPNLIFHKSLFRYERDLSDIVKTYNIDLIIFPGGPWYCKNIVSTHLKNQVKIITCWHFDPYELDWVVPKPKIISKCKLFIYTLQPLYSLFLYLINLRNFRYSVLNSNAFVLLSSYHIKPFKNRYFLGNANNIFSIPNANTYNHDNSSNIDELIKNKKKIILVVSRLDDTIKRISLIIKIWNKIEYKYPEWSLKIIGEGKDFEKLNNLCQDLKLKNIEFLGKINPENYYISSSILLTSSIREGWGMNIVEAQQYGCVPVVLGKYLALSEVIENNNGLVSNNCVNKFIDNIELLIKQPNLLEYYARNAILKSERFDQLKISRKWFELLNILDNEI